MRNGRFGSELGGRGFCVLWARWIWGDLGYDLLFDGRNLPSDRIDRIGGSLRDRRRTRLPRQSRDFHLDGVEFGLDGGRFQSVWSFHSSHVVSDSLELLSQFEDSAEVGLVDNFCGLGACLDGFDALLDVVGDGR